MFSRALWLSLQEDPNGGVLKVGLLIRNLKE